MTDQTTPAADGYYNEETMEDSELDLSFLDEDKDAKTDEEKK
jgi:hypothetical protein